MATIAANSAQQASSNGSNSGIISDVIAGLDWATGVTSDRSYSYTRRLQKHAIKFQREMANTAHQREVADLKAAGLNPVLSAGGQGAATPTVSAGQVAQGTSGAEAANAISNAITAREQAKQAKAQTKYLEDIQPQIAKSEINKNNAEAKKARADASLTEQTEQINEPDEETSKALKWWNSTWAGKIFNVAGDVIGKLSPFTAQAINYNSARQIRKGLENGQTTVQNTYNKKGDLVGSRTTTTKKHH